MIILYYLSKVHVTLDPVHMLKLCRNAFSVLRVFHSESGAVEYRYIEDNVRLQEEIGLKLGAKVKMFILGIMYINFQFWRF